MKAVRPVFSLWARTRLQIGGRVLTKAYMVSSLRPGLFAAMPIVSSRCGRALYIDSVHKGEVGSNPKQLPHLLVKPNSGSRDSVIRTDTVLPVVFPTQSQSHEFR